VGVCVYMYVTTLLVKYKKTEINRNCIIDSARTAR